LGKLAAGAGPTSGVGLALLAIAVSAAGMAAEPIRIGSAAAVTPVDQKIGEIARDFAGTDVFLAGASLRGLIERLHFRIQDEAFIRAQQNGAVPSAKSVAELKDAIARRKASIFVYDRDVPTGITNDLIAVANDTGIPVVGLGAKIPSGLDYQRWMLRQLNAIRGALNEASP
jgi:zinc/manganese transport system substrate-binding protein